MAEIDAEKTPINPIMNIPVPWVFVLVYFVGVGFQLMFPLALFPRDSLWSSLFRVAGITLAIVGCFLAGWCLKIFHHAKTTTVPFKTPSQLITRGPYEFTRNPMYVSLTIIYLGEAFIFKAGWPLVLLPWVLAYLNWVVIPVEEKRLAVTFGRDYEAFAGRVRRWL